MFSILVNDYLKQYAYVPTHSDFGLGGKWVPCTITPGCNLEGTWEQPCQSMRHEVAMYVAASYTEVNLVDLIGTKWVTHSEFCAFIEKYKNEYMATQRFGQAFLKHFRERFPDSWPEVFYCEDESKIRSILMEFVF